MKFLSRCCANFYKDKFKGYCVGELIICIYFTYINETNEFKAMRKKNKF